MAKVVVKVLVDEEKVKELSIEQWGHALECALSDWNDVYQTIALAYLGSGDHYRIVQQYSIEVE